MKPTPLRRVLAALSASAAFLIVFVILLFAEFAPRMPGTSTFAGLHSALWLYFTFGWPVVFLVAFGVLLASERIAHRTKRSGPRRRVVLLVGLSGLVLASLAWILMWGRPGAAVEAALPGLVGGLAAGLVDVLFMKPVAVDPSNYGSEGEVVAR
jgi:hypothetical protein